MFNYLSCDAHLLMPLYDAKFHGYHKRG